VFFRYSLRYLLLHRTDQLGANLRRVDVYRGDHATEHIVRRSTRIDAHDRAALRMASLPSRRHKLVERATDTVVELVAELLHVVVPGSLSGAREAVVLRKMKHERDRRDERSDRELVCRAYVALRETASMNLVRVCREEEPIQYDYIASFEGRLNLLAHQLRA
jgi:hypothetical protein